MAATLASLTQSLADTIKDRYSAAIPANDKRMFLAFEVGSPLPYSAFAPPDGQPAETRAVRAAEVMSRLANRAVRTSGGMLYSGGLFTIDGLYGMALQGSFPSTHGQASALYEAAKSDALQAFDSLLAPIAVPLPGDAQSGGWYRTVVAEPSNWYDPVAEDVWTRLEVREDSAHTETHPVADFGLRLNVLPADARGILEAPVSLDSLEAFHRLSPPRRVSTRSGDAATVDDLSSWRVLNETINMARVRGVALGPAELPLIEERRRRLFLTVRDVRKRPRVRPSQSGSEVTSSDFSASLDTCVVRLTRPWMSGQFLWLRDWYVPTFEKGDLSTGVGDGDTAPLGVVPTACVLARDVAISATWSTKDQTEVLHSSHLGVFSLMGRQVSGESGSVTLRIPGMQCIGWICEAMPVLPPLDPAPS